MWQIITDTVKSPKHSENQDAVSCFQSANNENIIVAVADGHGSKKCFRSQTGSRFAVETLVAIFRQLFIKKEFDNWQVSIKDCEQNLAKNIHRHWLDKVEKHLAKNPFSEDELNIDKAVNDYPVLSYGTTLLGAVITPHAILYIQLGDGDILTVQDNTVYRPLPKDEKLIANETYSLSSKTAFNYFNFLYQPVVNGFPDLIFLATDGYANSYKDETDFQKVAMDYCSIYKDDGADYIKQNINAWLKDTTENGSGDDITCAMIFKTNQHESVITD